MLASIILVLGIALTVSILWVRGIDKTKKDYPEYDGEDLFGCFDDSYKPKKENKK